MKNAITFNNIYYDWTKKSPVYGSDTTTLSIASGATVQMAKAAQVGFRKTGDDLEYYFNSGTGTISKSFTPTTCTGIKWTLEYKTTSIHWKPVNNQFSMVFYTELAIPETYITAEYSPRTYHAISPAMTVSPAYDLATISSGGSVSQVATLFEAIKGHFIDIFTDDSGSYRNCYYVPSNATITVGSTIDDIYISNVYWIKAAEQSRIERQVYDTKYIHVNGASYTDDYNGKYPVWFDYDNLEAYLFISFDDSLSDVESRFNSYFLGQWDTSALSGISAYRNQLLVNGNLYETGWYCSQTSITSDLYFRGVSASAPIIYYPEGSSTATTLDGYTATRVRGRTFSTTTVSSTNRNEYPDDAIQDGHYYKFIGRRYDISDSDIVGGVNYNITSNSDANLEVGTTASAEITFDTYSDDFTVDSTFYYFVQQNGDSDYRQVGKFTVYSCSYKNDLYSITAYDNVCKFDKDVYSWLHAKTFPLTVNYLFSLLCSEVGVTGNLGSHCNPNFSIGADFSTGGITGRQILQYLAQIGGCFVKADENGVVKFCTYTAPTTAISLNSTKYITCDIADYQAPAITKVHQALYEGDTAGYDAGTGTSVLNIVGNSAFYNETASTMQTAVNNIYNLVQNKSYYPTTIDLFNDQNANIGDIITVDGKTTLVMSKSWNSSGVTISCTGNNVRTKDEVTQSQDISQLNGKYNRLQRTVDETTSTVGQLGTAVSTISQKINNITLSVNPAVGESGSKIVMTMNGIQAAAANISLSGNVVFTSDLSGSGTTTINGDNITTGTIEGITINGDTIKGSTIYLGKGRGNSGLLEVFDEDDDVVATLDETGLQVGDAFYVKYDDTEQQMVTYLGGFKAYYGATNAWYLATTDSTVGMGDHPTWSFWAGSSGANPPFAVDKNGNLICANLTVNGTASGIATTAKFG